MKEQLETLKKWVQTGQVKTARGRSEDDLLTLIGQMEAALSQPPVMRSVCCNEELVSFKTYGYDECCGCGKTYRHTDA